MQRQIELFEAGFNRLIHALAALTALSIGLYAVLIPLNLFLIKFQLGNIDMQVIATPGHTEVSWLTTVQLG